MPIGTEFVHDASTTDLELFSVFTNSDPMLQTREKRLVPGIPMHASSTAKAYVDSCLYDERMNVWGKEVKSLIPRFMGGVERIKYVQRTIEAKGD